MKLSEGRIGNAEGVSILAVTLVLNGIFVMDIAARYNFGNMTYLTYPAAILVALLLFLLLEGAMRLSGKRRLPEFLDHAFGKAGGSILLLLLFFLLFADAYCLLSRFVTMVHTLVYGNDTAFGILICILAAAVFAALRGLECIGRSAKCFSVLLFVLLVCELLLPIKSYEVYRLFPFPASHAVDAAQEAFCSSFAVLPPLLLLLCLTDGLQGMKNAKRIGVLGTCIGTLLVGTAQLCIGMVYTAEELQTTFAPLYELNSKMVAESYFFRMDKVALFLWLIGVLLASAYEIYGAANLFCRRFSTVDVRPAVIALSVMLLFTLAAEHTARYMWLRDGFYFVYRYGALCLVLPLTAAAAVVTVRSLAGRRKCNEAN